MAASFLWYDLETFGLHKQWDRIAQFASVRTNVNLEEIEEPTNAYCRPSPDYLPDPQACLVSRITPQTVSSLGTCERDFSAIIYEQMIRPNTCTVGFNNIRFDDEFVRALFYRNFHDPYEREYRDGNSRWDVIDLLRMCHDLRPGGLRWVKDEDGVPVFKLEDLANANGIAPDRSHDALSDTRTTIALARLVLKNQPQLFRYYLELRDKNEVRRRLNLQQMEPVVHTSRMFRSKSGYTSIVIPLSVHPGRENVVITYDLRRDPDDWLKCDIEEIRRRVFTKADELDEGERIPFKSIHLNRCPAIAPLSTLSDERAGVLAIDLSRCLRNAEKLKTQKQILQKIREVYSLPTFIEFRDVDLQLYSGGFFIDADRLNFEHVRSQPPSSLIDSPPGFHDRRGSQLVWRYICRNFPDSLSAVNRERWRSHCATRLLTPEPPDVIGFGAYMERVKIMIAAIDTPAADKLLLKQLLDYGLSLEKSILAV